MSYSYSRFGNKYLKSEIEKTDDQYHEELKKCIPKVNVRIVNKNMLLGQH